MKKNLLAVSVAAALGLVAGSAAAAPALSATGIGHTNIIPYFSVQNGNVTLLSITNTDMANGKAVKVRFRGAEWSDDIFDFQVFLSPGDVFTGAVTNHNGVAAFATADTSCTLPTSVNQDFVPIRLENQTSGTLEGYIEIITMADIPADTVGTVTRTVNGVPWSLYKAIKHSAGTPPCRSNGDATGIVMSLTEDAAGVAGGVVTPLADQVTWMTNPTLGAPLVGLQGSLTSYATILNVNGSKAFANLGTAVTYTAAVKSYFQQANIVKTPAGAGNTLIAANIGTTGITQDHIFYPIVAAGTVVAPNVAAAGLGTGIPIYQFDLPDLSTGIEATPSYVQRNNLAAVLGKTAVMTEYSTLPSIQGATDMVLSQPLRRYYYYYNALAAAATSWDINNPGGVPAGKFGINGEDSVISPYSKLTQMNGNTVALDTLTGSSPATAAVFYDREEAKAGSNIVISPTPPGGGFALRGEVSVYGINATAGAASNAVGGKLTVNAVPAKGSGGSTINEGWLLLSTISNTVKLPLVGFTAQNAFNSNAGSAGTNYGTTLPLRYLP